MADIFDKETRSALMARIRERNTRPEVRLRRVLVVWECELRKPEGLPERLASCLGPTRLA